MDHVALQAARKLLYLDVAEAAEHIGKVTPRSWQHWEKGDRPIPDDVWLSIETMLIKRRDRLLLEFTPGDPNYEYYHSLDDWERDTGNRNVLWWRLAQSVASELIAENIVSSAEEEDL